MDRHTSSSLAKNIHWPTEEDKLITYRYRMYYPRDDMPERQEDVLLIYILSLGPPMARCLPADCRENLPFRHKMQRG